MFSPPTACARTRPCGSPASNVGKVKRVDAQEGTDNTVVTMEIDDAGPAAPRGRDGQDPAADLPRGQLLRRPRAGLARQRRSSATAATIGVTQTATPVQLDQVLTALQSDTRAGPADVLQGLGTALRSKPTAADDRDADPSARGETAAEVVERRLRGRRPGRARPGRRSTRRCSARSRTGPRAADRGAARASAGLVAQRGARSQELIVNFNRTMARVRLRGGRT